MQSHSLFRIVQAGLPDLDAVAELFNQYRIFYDQPDDLSAARHFIADRITNLQSVIFLAKGTRTGEPVVFIQLYPSFSSVSLKRLWILNDLFVQSDWRKNGVGRQLMDAARLLAMQSGAKGITLSTATDNRKAQALYESLGYIRETAFYDYNMTF